MSNAELIERLNEPEMYYPGNFDTVKRANAMLSGLCQEAADALAAADKRIEELECKEGGGCTLAGPGRGDCSHFVGLPGESIPGQHDGDDDIVDAYGKPNGWCWSCWKSHKLEEAERKLAVAREALKAAEWNSLDLPEFVRVEIAEALAQIGGDDAGA